MRHGRIFAIWMTGKTWKVWSKIVFGLLIVAMAYVILTQVTGFLNHFKPSLCYAMLNKPIL